MRKLVVCLVKAALVSSVMAVMAGCGSAAPADQSAATPTETTSIPLNSTTTVFTPPVDDSVSTPTPAAPTDRAAAAPTEATLLPLKPTSIVPTPPVDESASTPAPASSADDGLEFPPVGSSGTASKDEPITGVDADSSRKGGTGATGPVEGDPYKWQDGDRTMTVKLQTDLVVEKGSGGLPHDIVSANEGGTNVVRSADGQSKSDTLPVFRSESGALMTLPGGVLLVLSPEWSQAETSAFFSNNGIKMDRVSELDYAANGFFVETEPGFPSLDLANALAAQDGVEISSPNWGKEATPK